MFTSIANRKSKIANAFTLVELLVVIGIIAILMSILLPIIGAVRKSAYAADTKNQIRGIANAIDRYYTEQSAYPGVFSNARISAGKSVTGSPGPLTSTENCVLALSGGIATTAAWSAGMTIDDTTAYTYSSGTLGRGPLTFNNLSQKRLSAYLDATSQSMSMTGIVSEPIVSYGVSEATRGVNTGVPEFIDRYPAAMPVIYLRAKVGASGVVGVDGTPANATYQFDARDLLPYVAYNKGATANYFVFDTATFPANASNDQGNPSGNYPTTGGTTYPNVNFAGSYNYFLNASTLVAKNKDTYILISPGPDRIYGTSDDICNFSF